MEIHIPKPWHGLREFLKESLIIVVGVLTALGAEQAAQTVRQHGERAELRESLRRETDQILLDATRVEKSEHAEVLWERQIGHILVAADNGHQALRRLPPEPPLDFDIPDNPVYRAAQSSGKLTLLSKDEREVWSEIDGLLSKTSAAYEKRGEAIDATIQHHRQVLFGRTGASVPVSDDFLLAASFPHLEGSRFSPQEVRDLYSDTVRLEVKAADFLFWSRQVRGAAVALQRGDRNLRTVQAAERQFDHLP